MNRKIVNTLLASSMVFSMATSQMTMIHAVNENGIAIQDVDLETVQASYEKAIAEVKVPKYAKDGSKIDQGVSEYLRAKLDTKDLSATKEESKKLLTVDVQLKDVNLTSDYINGKSPAGISYYNMMNFFTNVKQVKQLLDANPGYQVKDSKGNVVDASYVDELLGLLQQINDFDPTTNLQYDYDSVYNSDAFTSETTRGGTDVIATSKEGNVSFKFHIDSHGWWGYDLGAHDSITGLVMGEDEKTANENQHDLTTEYGNFFVIKMKEDSAGTWYMLRDTDLENPMMYVSKDGKEAFMIDVDFYGENVLNEKIKAVIGDKCESLKIFLTHNHPDHVNNLDIIGQDETLRNITTIVWPEKEPHTNLNGKDLISDIQWKGVQTVKDMEKFTVAGSEFQFLEISNEHTPGGGQLADLTHKVIYSGDTLGAQVHLGGTTIRSGAQKWYDGAQKAAKYIKENGIQYNIGGHTPYLNNADFASWLATAVDYGMKVAPKGYTLVIVENGKVVNGTKRYEEIMANGLSDRDELNICSVGFIKSEDNGSAERAARSIILPRYEKDGTKVDQYISDDLKSHLALVDIEKVQDETQKTFTVNVQLKDVNLTSDYINGKSEPGISYYNMLSYYIDVLQVKELVDKNEGYSIIDSKGNKVDAAYVNELVGLLKQINDFDPTTDLQYDWDSAYDTDAFKNDTTRGATDVIATSKEGNVTLRFHIDSHGWWGYDLGAHDSITGLVMGYDADEAYDKQHNLTMDYGNFFVIKMKEDKNGTWYMLNDTDLQNPMIYVSKDGKEAFMIDVDFYGANVLNEKIKAVIGDKCESLKIFLTHNHGDHVNNLAVIGQDDELRNITTIVWPENEPHTVLSQKDGTVESMVGKDLISDIEWKSVETVKDMEKFTAAGVEFQFLEITDEHTPGGGQLADLTHKVIYSGDSLGAQVHLGGTTIRSGAQQWLDGAKKAAKYIKENGIKYNIGAHTPYLNNADFASWLAAGVEYGINEADEGYTLIIVENGKVINGTDRYDEIMKNGLSDRDELNICSLGFIKEKTDPDTPDQPENPDEPTKPSDKPNQPETPTKPGDTKKPDSTNTNITTTTDKTKDNVKTGDDTEIFALVGMMVLAGGTICMIKRKKHN